MTLLTTWPEAGPDTGVRRATAPVPTGTGPAGLRLPRADCRIGGPTGSGIAGRSPGLDGPAAGRAAA
ncbi:hypothetical protein [Streptomyces sp. NPDC018031]|uniref:hypothetical protein n=1 Tax=Streptomyces sp. NPDC018031 TaxID=3365033 RepID=UPI0037AA0EFA